MQDQPCGIKSFVCIQGWLKLRMMLYNGGCAQQAQKLTRPAERCAAQENRCWRDPALTDPLEKRRSLWIFVAAHVRTCFKMTANYQQTFDLFLLIGLKFHEDSNQTFAAPRLFCQRFHCELRANVRSFRMYIDHKIGPLADVQSIFFEPYLSYLRNMFLSGSVSKTCTATWTQAIAQSNVRDGGAGRSSAVGIVREPGIYIYRLDPTHRDEQPVEINRIRILYLMIFEYPPENFLYKMGCLKALTCMSFCIERLLWSIFMYFKTD